MSLVHMRTFLCMRQKSENKTKKFSVVTPYEPRNKNECLKTPIGIWVWKSQIPTGHYEWGYQNTHIYNYDPKKKYTWFSVSEHPRYPFASKTEDPEYPSDHYVVWLKCPMLYKILSPSGVLMY